MRIENITLRRSNDVLNAGTIQLIAQDDFTVKIAAYGLSPKGDAAEYHVTLTRNELAAIVKWSAK